ncbi:hypothetical protein [Variovorax sp. J22R115]|nr:hypothetical protein [Variovorax sp. J22R115]
MTKIPYGTASFLPVPERNSERNGDAAFKVGHALLILVTAALW